jgi:hypothetical protein
VYTKAFLHQVIPGVREDSGKIVRGKPERHNVSQRKILSDGLHKTSENVIASTVKAELRF